MKNIITKNWILALAAFTVLALGLAPIAALAADTINSTAPSTPWYFSSELLAGAIAFFSGIIAIWKNEQKKTAQKVSETLVLAIEEASKIPAVAEKEKAIKAKVQEVTQKYNVEPVVKKLVEKLT